MAGYRQYLLNDMSSAGIQIQYQGVYDPTTLGSQYLGYSPSMTALNQNYVAAFGGHTSLDVLNDLAGEVPSPGIPQNNPDFTPDMGGYWMTGGNGTGRGPLDPQFVLLMVGTNDPINAYAPAQTPAETDSNIAGIINWFRSNRPETTVLVASSPPANNIEPYGSMIETGVSQEATWLENNVNASQFPNARYVDVYDSFLNSDGSINNSLLTTQDGVHPSDAGYAVIASDFNATILQSVSVPEPSGILLVVTPLLFSVRRKIGKGQPDSNNIRRGSIFPENS